uniref:Thyroid hormone receptor associated protein 3 n=1 Tax=Cercocebus atys TaxID=9531 RepID=A0A2K5MD20_CERAT
SRSVSGSRKCRLSARSGSRSCSPAHNRERNHSRVYWNRDFRGHNRGYRRPYYFRGCNKGFYPWGQYNQRGYRNYHSNWQNYQQAYRPRSPSPRSRSHSRNSDKSSSDQSRRSSSSLESSKRKSAREKRSSSKDSWPCQAARDNQGDEAKEQTFSGGTSQDTKASESSKPWPDATYGTGSASGVSAVSKLSPWDSQKPPPVCGGEAAVTPSYPLPKPSPPLSSTSQMSSTLLSGAEYQPGTHQGQFDHGSWNSPSIGSTYVSSQKQESAAPGGAAYTKRYLEKKDKEQKQTNTDKEKIKEKGSFSDTGLGDGKMKSGSFAPKTDSEKPFWGSQSHKRYKHRDDFEKQMADFHKEEMDDEVIDANKNQEEEKSGKWEGLVYAPPGRGEQRKTEEMDEESFPERSKKEDWGKTTEVTAYKAVQEKSSSPPPRKTSESQDKLEVEDFSTGKSSFSITREAQVNVQMDSFHEDLAGPSGLLAQEHNNKKEQEFCSTFQHIQSAQSQRSPSELFAQHRVTIVHHVKEHHFGSSGMTLHERFTEYLKRGTEQEAAKNKNRPEIHRRIDAEGKYKDDPIDRSLDIERHKRFLFSFFLDGVMLCRPDSSPSRDSSAEKTEKTHKGSKKQKQHRRARDMSRSSSSSSQSSHSYKAEEYTEETEEREESTTGFEKSRLGTKGLVGGRTGGTFPFRARGRGWCRGSYSGNNNNNSNNFQKRNREEEWYPEYTPKSKKYYLHDDHEGEGSDKWEPFLGIGSCSRSRNQVPAPSWPRTSSVGEKREIEDDEKEKDNLQPTTE